MNDTQPHLKTVEKPNFLNSDFEKRGFPHSPDKSPQENNCSNLNTEEDSSGATDCENFSKPASTSSLDEINSFFESNDGDVIPRTEVRTDSDDMTHESAVTTPTRPGNINNNVDMLEEFDRIIRQSPRKNEKSSVVTEMDTSNWSEHDKKIFLEARKKLEEERNELIKKINSTENDEDDIDNDTSLVDPQIPRDPSNVETDVDRECAKTHETPDTTLLQRLMNCTIFNECTTSTNAKKEKSPKAGKKKKLKKTSSSSSVKNSKNMTDAAADSRTEFDIIMSSGLTLELASTLGSTKSVVLRIDQHRDNLIWGILGSKPISCVPLKTIISIENGFSARIESARAFSEDPTVRNRAFTITLKREAVSFVAPSELERESLVAGLKERLFSSISGDSFNLIV